MFKTYKAWKENKKYYHNCNCKQDQQSQKSSVLAIGINALESKEPKKKKKKRMEREFNTITCYNYGKKRHYANKYSDLPKN